MHTTPAQPAATNGNQQSPSRPARAASTIPPQTRPRLHHFLFRSGAPDERAMTLAVMQIPTPRLDPADPAANPDANPPPPLFAIGWGLCSSRREQWSRKRGRMIATGRVSKGLAEKRHFRTDKRYYGYHAPLSAEDVLELVRALRTLVEQDQPVTPDMVDQLIYG